MKHMIVFFPGRLSLLFLLVLIPILSISCRPDEERLLTDKNSRMRHIVQGPDGFLYVLTDEAEGKIFKMGI